MQSDSMFGTGLRHFSNVHTPDEPEAITIGVTNTRERGTEEFEYNGAGRLDSITVLRADDDMADGSDLYNVDTAAVAPVKPVHADGGKHNLALNGNTDTEDKAGMKEQIAGYKSISVIEMHEDGALCSKTSWYMNTELLEDVAATNGLIRFSLLTDSIDAEEIINGDLFIFSKLYIELDTEELDSGTLDTSLSAGDTVEDDVIADGWFLGNCIPEFDDELAVNDILWIGRIGADTLDDDKISDVIAGVALADEIDRDEAAENDLIIFPSVLSVPEESLSPPGIARYAILETVASLDDEDAETAILETRRTGLDVNEVSTGAGKPRNCNSIDTLADESDSRVGGAFTDDIATTNDPDKAAGIGQ